MNVKVNKLEVEVEEGIPQDVAERMLQRAIDQHGDEPQACLLHTDKGRGYTLVILWNKGFGLLSSADPRDLDQFFQ